MKISEILRALPKRSRMVCPAAVVTLLAVCKSSCSQAIPIQVNVPKAGYVTVVIDDADGRRVRNLISETPMPAGKSTLYWDGYDEGRRSESGDGDIWMHALTRRRANPGAYTVHGLVHDRLTLNYEFSVNSAGTPPWSTRDGSGAWLADHSPPADIIYLAKGTPAPNGLGTAHFLVCSSSGEAGEEFVWLDSNGRRLYGTNTGFWGGTHFARDPGPRAVKDDVAYVFMSGERDPDNNTLEVRAIKSDGRIVTAVRTQFPVELKKSTLPTFKSVAEEYGTDGVAAYNGIVVFSVTHQNRLVFADAQTHKIIGEASAPSPRGMTFDRSGRLWMVSGSVIRRYDVDAEHAKLGDARVVVSGGLDEPRRVVLDDSGRIYVSTAGTSHQVDVFSPGGRLLQTIGLRGGPQLGAYNPRKMSYPSGMTVDDRGRLWVAEAEIGPKRISVWNLLTGTFERALYGPSQYGGGGKIDGFNTNRLFMDAGWSAVGVTWTLDWKQGTGAPSAIFWRGDNPGVEHMPDTLPETTLKRAGFTYMVDCYNDKLRYNQDRGVGIWRLDSSGVARPTAIIGNAADLINGIWGIPLRNRNEITALWKDLDPATVMYLWTDKNGDQIAQPDEIQFRQVMDPETGRPLRDAGLGAQILPDLSIVTSWGIRIPAPQVDSRGMLTYDINKTTFVGDTAKMSERVPAGDHVLYNRIGPEGLTGGNIDGKQAWSYQSSEGGQPAPGLLIEPTRLMGLPVTPMQGDAGPIFAFNSDKGGIYLMTMDGIFLQTLGGDARSTPLWRTPAAEAHRGMTVDQYSFGEEHFHPTIVQAAADGKIYLVVGMNHSSITRLEGLETVARLPQQTISVSEQDLETIPEITIERPRQTGRSELTIKRLQGAPSIADVSTGWNGASWVAIDSRASAAVAVAGDRLYAAWKLGTGDANHLTGGPGDYRYQFKRGGALDLMIAPDNERARNRSNGQSAHPERLLVTRVSGKTRAVLYVLSAPGTSPPDSVLFQSPIGSVRFDRVADVSDSVELVSDGKGDYEISCPLSLLGFDAMHLPRSFAGDIGLLRGDGAQTVQRVYWNNQDTGIVSDIPSESRLRPENWGVWHFE